MSRPLYDEASLYRERCQVRHMWLVSRRAAAKCRRRTDDERRLLDLGFAPTVAAQAARRELCGAPAGVLLTLAAAGAVWLVLR